MSKKLVIQISEVHPSIVSRFNLNQEEDFEIDLEMYNLSPQIIQKIFKNYNLYSQEILSNSIIEEVIRLLIHYKLDDEAEEILNKSLYEKKELNKEKLGRILSDFSYYEKLKATENIDLCCEKGWLEPLIFAHRSGKNFNKVAAHLAARNGHLNILIYLRDNHCLFDKTTLMFAVESGNLECVKYIYEEIKSMGGAYEIFTYISAQHGYLDLLKFAAEKRFHFNRRTAEVALKHKHLDCVFFALENGCEVKRMDEKAAELGLLELLIFCKKTWKFTCNTIYCAAFSGHLDCLEYLYKQKCPWDNRVTFVTAQNGHLSCLKFALENKCEIHESAAIVAVSNGHCHCLEALLQYNVPRNKKIVKISIEKQNWQALVIAIKYGCEFDFNNSELVNQVQCDVLEGLKDISNKNIMDCENK